MIFRAGPCVTMRLGGVESAASSAGPVPVVWQPASATHPSSAALPSATTAPTPPSFFIGLLPEACRYRSNIPGRCPACDVALLRSRGRHAAEVEHGVEI